MDFCSVIVKGNGNLEKHVTVSYIPFAFLELRGMIIGSDYPSFTRDTYFINWRAPMVKREFLSVVWFFVVANFGYFFPAWPVNATESVDLRITGVNARTQTYRKSAHSYVLPELTLVNTEGRQIHFPEDINDGRPTVLNFIYATCTAICPLLTQTFSQLQKKLGGGADKVRMVSISIDPEQDTPKRLSEYAKRYLAGPQWTFYTGTRNSSIAAQKAFEVYTVDKMSHPTVAFIRQAPGQPWLRLEGFTTAEDLLRELKALAKEISP